VTNQTFECRLQVQKWSDIAWIGMAHCRDADYGQFCPVAKAAEILAERWTPLLVYELLMGCHRF
jgi:hypothetical protein